VGLHYHGRAPLVIELVIMSEAITVLGAGSVGVSTAIHLQQRGWKVTLVDRATPGRETSYGNAGVINPASCIPLNSPDMHRSLAGLLGNKSALLRYDLGHVLQNLTWVLGFLQASKTGPATLTARALAALTSEALVEHQALMQRTGNQHRLTEVGWLKVFRQGHFDSQGFGARLLNELEIPVEYHDRASLAKLEPALKPVFDSGIVMPGGGLIDNPSALIDEHVQRFVADGGVLLQRDITRLSSDSSGLHCRSTGDSWRCNRLVIAAGPWSADLLATIGYDVPLGVERGYHAHYPFAGTERLGRSVHDVQAGYVMSPMTRGLRVTTGVELAARDAPSNPAQLEMVEPRVREAIDIGERTADPVWRGSRPTLPDSRPVIGPAPLHENIWVNFGHQHIGLMTGPVSGKLLAQGISGETPDIDMAPFAPKRYLTLQGRRRRRRLEKQTEGMTA